MAAAIITCTFTACSSDDDDNGGGTVPGGSVTTFDGQLLSRTGDMTFMYDDKGRCTDIALDYEGDDFLHIDYDKRTIMIDGEFYNVTFNSSGYITSLSQSINEKEDGYTMKATGRITIEYDGKGHITGGRNEFSFTASGDGENFSETDFASARYQWEGNLLTKMTCDEETRTNGKVTGQESTTYTMTYYDIDNKYCQWTHAAETFMMMGDCLGFVGMFGKMPDKLVSSFTKSGTDNGNIETPETTGVTYTLNPNGTIATEQIGRYNTYHYTYFTPGESDARQHTYGTRTTVGRTGMTERHSPILMFRDKMRNMKGHIMKR